MLSIDYILYKINTTISSSITLSINAFTYYVDTFFSEHQNTDEGYTIISKDKIKYISYEELWNDTD